MCDTVDTMGINELDKLENIDDHIPETGSAYSLPSDLLIDYPPSTACIRWRDGLGQVKDWFISASAKDTEETLRAHLQRFIPGAEFVGWVFKGVK